MDGLSLVRTYAARVEADLESFFADQHTRLPRADMHGLRLLEVAQQFVARGGKRLRPLFCYLGHLLFGGIDDQRIVQASSALELVHAFLLVHDDIMDQSATRRGLPSVHKQYQSWYESVMEDQQEAARAGECSALLVGDLLASLATDRLITAGYGPEKTVRALRLLSRRTTSTIYGQELDMHFSYTGRASVEEILQMYRLKTSYYSLVLPLEVGGVLAGMTREQRQLLSFFGVPVGVAFQIQDDMLGVYGDERQTGKPVGTDIRQGKQSLLVAYAFAMAKKGQREHLRATVGNAEASDRDVQETLLIIEQTGAKNRAQRDIRERLAHARTVLHRLNGAPEPTQAMLAVLRLLEDRDH